MKDSQELRRIRLFMANVNYLWTLFYALFVYMTILRVIREEQASSFLNGLNTMPRSPHQMLILSIVLSTALLLILIFGHRILQGNAGFAVYAAIELALALFILSVDNYDNTGILLIIAADWIVFDCDTEDKVIGMIVLLTCYVLARSPISIPGFVKIDSWEYLQFYERGFQGVLMLLRSIIFSGTTMGFILYLVLAMRLAEKENERVRQLNIRLDTANEELRTANEKLEEYSRTVEKMSQTRERNRLAREIHDTLGHTLTGLISCMDACLTLIDDSKEDTKKILYKARDVARQGMVDVRRSVSALRPDALESLSLEEAVQRIMREMSETGGVRFFCEIDLEGLRFDDDEEDTIYRIVQESITNSVSHGKATEIYVGLKKTYGAVHIRICDNGTGCPDYKKGFGLVHMQERARLLGGSVCFDGNTGLDGGKGFAVHAEIPIRWGK